MTYLKLFRDEPETEAPQPIPFRSSDRTWRSTDAQDHSTDRNGEGTDSMDSITRVENALQQVENVFENLTEQVNEYCEPIRMADWLEENDDGPYAA
jgi:hypothetical protein